MQPVQQHALIMPNHLWFLRDTLLGFHHLVDAANSDSFMVCISVLTCVKIRVNRQNGAQR